MDQTPEDQFEHLAEQQRVLHKLLLAEARAMSDSRRSAAADAGGG